MKRIVITYGLISGLIVSSIMAVGMAMCATNPDYKPGELMGYGSMILSFSLIFVGVKIFRDRYNGGTVSFGKAFLIGFYISLIASTCYVVTWALEYNFVFPDFMVQYSAKMIKDVKASGLSPEKIDAKLKQLDSIRTMYKNPLFFTLFTYAEILPVGLVISLICALILKRKEPKAVVVV